MTDKDKLLELLDRVLEQRDSFYQIIKLQYPSEDWLELTEAEKHILLWFNDIEQDYKKYLIEDILN